MKFDDLLRHVLPSVKGCPDELALFHLRHAAQEFLADTLAWSEWLPNVVGKAGVDTYYLFPPSDAEIVKLTALRVDGAERDLTGPAKGRSMSVNGCNAEVAWTEDRVRLFVSPAPTADGTIYAVRAALTICDDATTLDDDIGRHYGSDIANGAIAALLEIEGAVWENQQRAMVRRERFNDAIATTGARVAKGFGSGQRRSKAFLY